MKKKIVYVNHSAALGGADLSLLSIVVHFAENKENDVLVVLPGNGPLKTILEEHGIIVVERSIQSWRLWAMNTGERIKAIFSLPLVIINYFRWVSFFKSISPDLVHFNLNRIMEPVLAAKAAGVSSVMHFRDIPDRVRPQFLYGRFIFYWILNQCNVWIANSNATREAILPNRRGAISMIYNGIDLTPFAFARPKQNGEKVVLAMIGTLTEWKNQADFIALAERLHARNFKVDCWIVGEGPTGKALQKLVRDKGLTGVVSMKGFVKDIPDLLSGVDILVHTMAGESFGRVFVEAGAAGIPVVAYRSGGSSEILVDEESGFLVEDFNIDDLEQCVIKLVSNQSFRMKMGLEGKRRVEEKFGIKQMLSQITEVYASLLKSTTE